MTLFTDEFELDDFDEDIDHAEKQIINTLPDASTHGMQTERAGLESKGIGAPGTDQTGNGSPGESQRQALGLFPDISNFDYHNMPDLGSTDLKNELVAPKVHHAYDIGELVFEPTRQMRLGSAVHVLTLEPFEFDNQVALLPPKGQGNQKSAKEFKVEFKKEHRGKIIIPLQDRDTVHYMRDALMEHPEAGEILQDRENKAEWSGFYKDVDEEGYGTHLGCKFRPDTHNPNYQADIKSTVDASRDAFEYTIGKFGYDISAAHYTEGDKHTTGATHERFAFLAVESKPPYLVAVYWLDPPGFKVGHWRRRKALHSIRQCRAKQHWPGYNNDEGRMISVPSRLIYQMENETL